MSTDVRLDGGPCAARLLIAAAVVHNLEYAITGVEESTFILMAILGWPTLLLAGLGGLVWTSLRGRHASRSSGGPASPLA